MTSIGEDPQQGQQSGRHAAAEGADRHPLIDMDRDPTPGKADHARPGEDDE